MTALQCRVCHSEYVGHHLTKECDECRFKPCVTPGCDGKLRKSTRTRYCSPKCKASNPNANKMENRTQAECPCGNTFDKYKLNTARQRYCSEFCLKKYDRRGHVWRNDPEAARTQASKPKPNHGLRGHKQTDEHLFKRLGNGSIRPSGEELSLVPFLTRLGYRHTGDGSFWRRWKNGTAHNPDFVCEATRTVLEYFGDYWHREDRGREQEIIDAWAEIGYACVIVWPEDREVMLRTAVL